MELSCRTSRLYLRNPTSTLFPPFDISSLEELENLVRLREDIKALEEEEVLDGE